MGIDEPWIHGGALRILYDFATVGVQDFVLFAYSHDLTFVDGHSLRLGTRTIQTDNVGISNHKVSGLLGQLATNQKKTKDAKVTSGGHDDTL